MKEKANIFESLEKIAEFNPSPFYWLDLKQRYLGINKHLIEATGTTSYKKDFANKTPYDLFPKEMADNIVQHHKQVIKTGEPISAEESIKNKNGKIKHFQADISPLYDDNGKIVGTVGVSVEITEKKKEIERQKKVKVFEHLKKVSEIIPAPFYWFDENQKYLGVNTLVLKVTGTRSYKENFAEKTPYDVYPKEMAKNIIQHHKEVLQTKKMLSVEESIKDVTTGETKYFNAIIAPLYDDYDQIIGTIGISIETTAEKEAARLQFEMAAQTIKLEEHKKFEEVVRKVAHDICSPLATLKMYMQMSQNELPEKMRVVLSSSVDEIRSTADGILRRYKKSSAENLQLKDAPQPAVLSMILSQTESEKKYEYQKLPIEFNLTIEPKDNFTSAKISPLSFKRMLSNLINNSVDAFAGKDGTVNLKLESDAKQVKIIVEDNGKGMPKEIIAKILSREEVSSGKENGHGIGMTQIHETLEKDGGVMTIDSKVGKGTKITLTYLRTEPPEWIAQKIEIKEGDTVVILDDELPIHEAWDLRLKEYEPKITIQHFTLGSKAEEFINNAKNKDKILLLSDYQLLKQNTDGLKVIEKTKINRAILVTSYHTDPKVLGFAALLKIKTLPKSMAADILIDVV